MFELFVPLALVATFGTVYMAGVALSGKHARRARLARHIGTETIASMNLRSEALAKPPGERLILPLLSAVGRAVRRFTPLGTRKKIENKLVLAGSPPSWDVMRIVAAKVIGGSFALLLGSAAMAEREVDAAIRLLFVGAFAWLGYRLPDAMLSARARRRQDEIRRALPDTIDLLTIMVEAGLGFDAALAQVVVKVPGPLSSELSRMLQEIRLGVSRLEAFRSLASRVHIDELDSFVTAMTQADSFGVSISKVLRAQSTEQRSKRKQRAELKAHKLAVKMVFPLIFCVLPAVFVVAVGPAVLKVMQTFIGM